MFFTQEDFLKIESWLKQRALKNTDFKDASLPINGGEVISIVQEGCNRKILVKDFISQLFKFGDGDFINVTDFIGQSNIEIEQAIGVIPYKKRKLGQVITFLDEDNKWRIYQFTGETLEQWCDTSLWIDVISSIIVDSVLPDEEDVTGIKQGENEIIKFKDKDYNPQKYSGLGRKYLRKNIVGDKNILTQEMINDTNTRYIIQYDYDLNGEEITISEGCILDFQGGKIGNGTIQLNNTKILPKGDNIIDHITATISGNYAEGQILYDSELRQMKLWNGTEWINEDGTLTSKVRIV